MADFKDYGSGALFTNKKEKDSQPDYAGPLTVEGRKYRMVAWTGTDKFGKTFLSVKVNEWREPETAPIDKGLAGGGKLNRPPEAEPDEGDGPPFGDEIPW